MFENRADAGRQLAERLMHLKGPKTVVLGIPRGGLVVAHEVAKILNAPLEALIVRKIGHRLEPEAAVGAIGPDGKVHYTTQGMTEATAHADDYAAIVRKEKASLEARKKALGAGIPDVHGKTVIVVDDGIATGASLKAGLHWLKNQKPARIVAAVPCAPTDTAQAIRRQVDEWICPMERENFAAVGQFYRDFREISDEETKQVLKAGALRVKKQRQ